MAKVTFDGPNKLIIVDNGVTELDAIVDLYSDWKEWAVLSDNMKYLHAFEAIGGQPLPGGLFAGSTIFLVNGWKIRPHEAHHTLTIKGNIFTNDGSSIHVPTLGNYTVTVSVLASALAQGIAVGSVLTSDQSTQLSDAQRFSKIAMIKLLS